MHLRGWGLATLSFIRYNITQGLLGRICLKSFNKIENYPFPYPTLKKLKFPKFFFVMIFFKRKLSYVITRSGKFGNLVTSFFISQYLRFLVQLGASEKNFEGTKC